MENKLPPLTIRLFENTEADKARVNGFFDSLDPEARAFFNHGDGNRRATLRYFDDPVADSQDVFRLMAVDEEGRMVGYLFAAEINTGVPGIGLGVSSGFKGRGLGRMLIDEAWSRLKALGATGMWLCTHQANLRAQMLYYNYGFEHMGNHTSGEMFFLYRKK